MISENIANQLNRFETGIGPMTDRVLNNIVDKVTSGNFQEILTNKIADPIMHIINKKTQPYIFGALVLYIIVVILLIWIIYLLLSRRK